MIISLFSMNSLLRQTFTALVKFSNRRCYSKTGIQTQYTGIIIFSMGTCITMKGRYITPSPWLVTLEEFQIFSSRLWHFLFVQYRRFCSTCKLFQSFIVLKQAILALICSILNLIAVDMESPKSTKVHRLRKCCQMFTRLNLKSIKCSSYLF